jgi:hypothetical protein
MATNNNDLFIGLLELPLEFDNEAIVIYVCVIQGCICVYVKSMCQRIQN